MLFPYIRNAYFSSQESSSCHWHIYMVYIYIFNMAVSDTLDHRIIYLNTSKTVLKFMNFVSHSPFDSIISILVFHIQDSGCSASNHPCMLPSAIAIAVLSATAIELHPAPELKPLDPTSLCTRRRSAGSKYTPLESFKCLRNAMHFFQQWTCQNLFLNN